MRLQTEVEPFNGAAILGDPPVQKKRVRYAPNRTFPSYRYVPGSGQPHPVNDPRGSMYSDVKPPPHPEWTPHLWPVLPEWLYGVDLYNHWYFWEAHEAWEGMWQVVDKTRPGAIFVQALIQVSAAMLKVHLKSDAGVRALWGGAQGRLTQIAGEHKELMGLRPSKVLKEFEAYFKPLKKGQLPTLGKDTPLLLLDV